MKYTIPKDLEFTDERLKHIDIEMAKISEKCGIKDSNKYFVTWWAMSNRMTSPYLEDTGYNPKTRFNLGQLKEITLNFQKYSMKWV